MGRLSHGFPASPSLKTQVTSAIFHTVANVLGLKEFIVHQRCDYMQHTVKPVLSGHPWGML